MQQPQLAIPAPIAHPGNMHKDSAHPWRRYLCMHAQSISLDAL
jgi:hypothetical protein